MATSAVQPQSSLSVVQQQEATSIRATTSGSADYNVDAPSAAQPAEVATSTSPTSTTIEVEPQTPAAQTTTPVAGLAPAVTEKAPLQLSDSLTPNQFSGLSAGPPPGLMDAPNTNGAYQQQNGYQQSGYGATSGQPPLMVPPVVGPPSGFRSTRSVTQQTANQRNNSSTSAKVPDQSTISHDLPLLSSLVDPEQVAPYWQLYLDHIRERGEMSLIGLLTSRSISVEPPNTIIVPITGTIEESILLKGKEDMTLMMRRLTSISNLMIRSELVEETTDSRRPYTQNDKYQLLAQKHPVLETLRQKFGMDFDY